MKSGTYTVSYMYFGDLERFYYTFI